MRVEPEVGSDMEPIPPYYAEDTDGVHFQVQADGRRVWGHVARELLIRLDGGPLSGADAVAAYRRHQFELDRCVAFCARLRGPETVILTERDLHLCDIANRLAPP